MEILRVENLCKSYQMGEVEVKALTDASFSVEKGEFVVVLGPSGSGREHLAQYNRRHGFAYFRQSIFQRRRDHRF